MEKKLQKIYPTYYNLLIVQDLWQALYQILSMIFLKELNMDTIIKNVKLVEFTYKVPDCFLEETNFKGDLIECECLCCNKSYLQKFDEKLEERFFNTYKFSNNDNNKFILLL